MDEKYLRDTTREQVIANPGMAKLEVGQAGYYERQIINDEIDRVRREQDERARRERGY